MKKGIPPEETGNIIYCLQPSRPILCVTKNEDGSNHVAPFGWCTPVSQYPPMLSLAIAYKPNHSVSLLNIERTGEFTVNLPDMDLADKMVETSFKTKFGENKFERSGFTPMSSKCISPVCIQECRAHLECRVREILYLGDHAIVLADILHACYDDDAFGKHMLIDTRKFRPVIHLQDLNLREADAQMHLFLKADSTEAVLVSFPEKND